MFIGFYQIESLSYGVTGRSDDLHYSQFVSIDITGKVIFWMTQQTATVDNSTNDDIDINYSGNKQNLGLSPWSNIMLTSMRSLHVDSYIDYDLLLSPSTGSNDNNNNKLKQQSKGNSTNNRFADLFLNQSSISCSKTIMGIVPNDMSTLYLSTSNGRIQRLSKYHSAESSGTRSSASNTLCPSYYNFNTRCSDNMTDWINMSVSNDKTIYSAVTSLSIQEKFVTTMNKKKESQSIEINSKLKDSSLDDEIRFTTLGECSLVLVGRADGCIDLYGADDGKSFLLNTWNTLDYKQTSNLAGFDTSVVALKWCPMRASTFFALTMDGTLFYFDLLVDSSAPLFKDSLPYMKESNILLFDVCLPKYSNSSLYLVMNCKNKNGINSIQAHKLSNIAVKLCKSADELIKEDKTLRSSLLYCEARSHH